MLETIPQVAQAGIAEALYESAKTHADASNGLLVAYPPDYKEHPFISLSYIPSHYRLKGRPLPPVLAYELATAIDPRFEHMPKIIRAYDASTERLTRMGDVLLSGQNVITASDHKDIMDEPLAVVGFSGFFREQGIPHRSMMIVSKAMDYLGVNIDAIVANIEDQEKRQEEKAKLLGKLSLVGVGTQEDGTVLARDILELAADYVFFTFPSSKTFEGMRGKWEGKEIQWYNEYVLRKIGSVLSRKGVRYHPPVFMHVATPGTTNKQLDEQAAMSDPEIMKLLAEAHIDLTSPEHKPVEVIGWISHAVRGMLKQALVYPASMRLHESDSKVAVGANGLFVGTEERVEALGDEIVKIVQSIEPDIQVTRDKFKNLPVVRS